MIPHAGTWSWRTLFRVLSRVRRVRPDIVHTWLFTADLYGRLAACLCRAENFLCSLRHGRQAGRPVIMSAVRSVEFDKPAHYVAVDRLLRHVTDAYTVNAHAISKVLTKREHVDPSKIRVIYNGVDLEKFQLNGKMEDGRWKMEKSIPPSTLHLLSSSHNHAPLIGIVGRLSPVKDHATFLQAAARVVRELPQTRFLIVGSGPLEQSLKDLACNLQLAACVHFLESQSDVVGTFAALDVVVVSSRYEGCSNVILEGMAMAKPVIATAVGGNPELVIPNQNGLLVEPKDPDGLARAIAQLVRDPGQGRAMGRAGRLRIEQQFSLGRMLDEYERLYMTVGRGEPQP